MIEGAHLTPCREGADRIDPGSVDCIITDPPYVAAEWRDAYTDLAAIAGRVLRPGGFLISYAGHYNLPGVMEILGTRLTWYWIMGQVNQGCRALVHARNLVACWKPILVYAQPPVTRQARMGNDLITSGEMEKRYHTWQQALAEALYLVELFSSPGDLILDPFMGSGTIPLAAKLLGRRWIGFEIDPNTFMTAKGRLTQAPLFSQGAEQPPPAPPARAGVEGITP